MSTYRDDLEAAHARADAAEDEAERLRKEVERLKQPERAAQDAPIDVPIPERFKVERGANELRVSWRWWRPHHVFMLFFAIAWDAFLLFWYFGPMAGQGGWLFTLFPIAHVAVGVGVTYSVLTGFLNRTVVRAERGWLRVGHGPLPARGNHSIAIADIRQLFVSEVEARQRDTSNQLTVTMSYDLCAVLMSGRELRLVRRLESKPQALYLEQAFEHYLGIDDRRVPGEVPKT